MIEQHLTTTGAARFAGRSAETIRAWARCGILVPLMAPAGIRIFLREDVLRVARERDERRRSRSRGSNGDGAA
jgi:DNA-binding transcriptional MerR regulator